jgi:hypothetical protein
MALMYDGTRTFVEVIAVLALWLAIGRDHAFAVALAAVSVAPILIWMVVGKDEVHKGFAPAARVGALVHRVVPTFEYSTVVVRAVLFLCDQVEVYVLRARTSVVACASLRQRWREHDEEDQQRATHGPQRFTQGSASIRMVCHGWILVLVCKDSTDSVLC